MDALRRFAAIVHADFRERSRSTRFWVVLCGVGIATWWLFPASDAGYVTVGVGGARGLYSSACVGMVLGMLYASTLSLFGFYIVRGTLSRDFETRVWQLLVATPMTRPGYLLAKWTSHMLVFALLVAVGLGIGLVAQQWHGEATDIDLWQLVLPSLVPSGTVIGCLLPGAAAECGLPAGLPVAAGAIDLLASLVAVGASFFASARLAVRR